MPRNSDVSMVTDQDVDTKMSAWNSLLYTLGAAPADSNDGSSVAGQVDTDQVPVTILSGFLGAGKTTLLCNLLAETQLNVLAIVNDLAAVNIDATLVRAENAETIQLENGCACCVLGNDLDLVLSEIGTRNEKPDAIIIEASGVSDPMGIAQTVANNARVTLDGVLTLVDANTLAAQLVDPISSSLMRRQLSASHLVLLTKISDESVIPVLQDTLGEIVPGRAVISLDTLKSSLETFVLGARIRGARPEPGAETHSYADFENRLIEFSEPLEADAFFALVEDIPGSVYRIKGWLTLQKEDAVIRQEFQAVGSRWRVSRADTSEQSDQLVVIGRAGTPLFDEFCAKLQRLNRS